MTHEKRDPYEEGISEEESRRRVIAALTEGLRPGEHPYSLRRALEYFEKKHISRVLEITGHDIKQTARLLGITQKMLAAKMKEHGLT